MDSNGKHSMWLKIANLELNNTDFVPEGTYSLMWAFHSHVSNSIEIDYGESQSKEVNSSYMENFLKIKFHKKITNHKLNGVPHP